AIVPENARDGLGAASLVFGKPRPSRSIPKPALVPIQVVVSGQAHRLELLPDLSPQAVAPHRGEPATLQVDSWRIRGTSTGKAAPPSGASPTLTRPPCSSTNSLKGKDDHDEPGAPRRGVTGRQRTYCSDRAF